MRSGTLGSYAAAARLGHVSRARLSQILSLLNLAPDLQEENGRSEFTIGAFFQVSIGEPKFQSEMAYPGVSAP